MKISIVALGQTAKYWDGSSPSIAVNDAFRWGFQPTYLLILNTPNQFTEERLNIIKKTKPHKLYTDHPTIWGKFLDKDLFIQPFTSKQWAHSNRLQKISTNYLYHSKTSPFAAISLAFSWGFKDIILWGVDMVDHRTYRPGTGEFINEHANYKTFCASLKDKGCNVYLGHEGSTLNFLPIWQKG